MKTTKTSKKTNKADGQYLYAIMLDYEVDLVDEYWPIRYQASSLESVSIQMWINGNPSLLPRKSHEAVLIRSKSLADKKSRQEFSGGIYRFNALFGENE